MYVVHDADTGEVLAARSGSDFTWDPAQRHVAFVAGKPGQQALVVDGQERVAARGLTTRCTASRCGRPTGTGWRSSTRATGAPRLVVLVEFDDPQGDLTWPVPRDALGAGAARVLGQRQQGRDRRERAQAEVRGRLGAPRSRSPSA